MEYEKVLQIFGIDEYFLNFASPNDTTVYLNIMKWNKSAESRNM